MSAPAAPHWHPRPASARFEPHVRHSTGAFLFGFAVLLVSVLVIFVNVVWLVALGYLYIRGDITVGLIAMMAPVPVLLIGVCVGAGCCGRRLLS